eukprot:8347754-Lingulodinium_polyedra.AAC.1
MALHFSRCTMWRARRVLSPLARRVVCGRAFRARSVAKRGNTAAAERGVLQDVAERLRTGAIHLRARSFQRAC